MPHPDPAAAAPTNRDDALFWPRLVEFMVLYVALPPTWFVFPEPRLLIPALLAGMACCLVVLLRDPAFDRRRLWDARTARARLGRIRPVFFVCTAALTAGVLLFLPDLFLSLPRRNPVLWGFVMVAYPLLSVYPQEIIYRVYFFHRYRVLFPTAAWMTVANAAAFAYAHVIFRNPTAVLLTLIGGSLFAWTYWRTRSAAATWVEHALYGCVIFTVGLGRYFFLGATGR
jgi:membrane protease YdiL (CAAX protease family)